ncbi:hypothetical protein BGW37DRAFT_496674 [Umbelopsis sp. PMI_123]|nr:hypothetical protein BGW37DRAFT_496674 [Umbelopsis sp. PMI_123]
MVKYSVNERAYALPLLHAAKYPASEVCGILLGDTSSNSDTVNITRAVPLFHHWTTLTPMLELALQQVDLYATKNKLDIVGWYVGNENNTERSLNEHTIKTIDKIWRQNENAIVFLIDNDNIDLHNNKESAILPLVKTGGQWQHSKSPFTAGSDFELINVDTFAKVRGLISNGQYKEVADFDIHLEDASVDWLTNSNLHGL